MVRQNPLSSSLTAFWNGTEVEIHGGFRSASLGHKFEISSPQNGITRQNVSVWALQYHSEESAQEIFRVHFDYLRDKENPTKTAIIADRRKGLNKEKLVVVIHNKVININQEQETAVEAA